MFDPLTRILVVDDQPSMRAHTIKILRDMGYTLIAEADDGDVAFEKIKKSIPPFDLVITDLHMPKTSGIELAKLIRANQEFQQTPILLSTTEAQKDIVVQAIKSGADGYIIKPVQKETLTKHLLFITEKRKKQTGT